MNNESLKQIKRIIDEANADKSNKHFLADKNIEIISYMFTLGEDQNNAEKAWSSQFLLAKRTKNPESNKFYTDKEAECIADIKVPEKNLFKNETKVIDHFIRNTKVKVAVLGDEEKRMSGGYDG